MKLGLIADAHGNPRALARCLQALERLGTDRVYFLGDAVGYLPGENEVLDILRVAPVLCQAGNHEAMLMGKIPLSEEKDRVYGIRLARERISRSNSEFVQSWPEFREIDVDDRKIFMVHGSLDDHFEGYVYSQRDLSFEKELSYDAIFMGHTHYPFVSNCKGIQVANVGSCGLPRDQGNLSSFAIYDTGAHRTEIFRLLFDSGKIAESSQQVSIPQEVIDCLNRRSLQPFGLRINEDIL